MTSAAEEWRDIPGYEGRYQASNQGRYQASNQGRIRSVGHYVTRWVSGKVLTPRIREAGYPVVAISGKGPQDVHRLVALAFHGPAEPGKQVRHLNGDKLDPRPENLAWGDQSENERDKFRYGDRSRKLTTGQVREIRRLAAKEGANYSAIAREYRVTETTVRHIAKGVTFAWLK